MRKIEELENALFHTQFKMAEIEKNYKREVSSHSQDLEHHYN